MKIEIDDKLVGKFTWEIPELDNEILNAYYKLEDVQKNLEGTIIPLIAHFLAILMSGVILSPVLSPTLITIIDDTLSILLSDIEQIIRYHP